MYGYVFKPTEAVEINYQLGDIDERLKMSFSIGYYALSTTRDTFFTVGVQYGGIGTKALEGYNIWKDVWVVPIGVNVDYKIESILAALKLIDHYKTNPTETDFGQGNSAQLFLESIGNMAIWKINHQKQFRDI